MMKSVKASLALALATLSLSACLASNTQKTTANVNCLTHENFKLVVTRINKNSDNTASIDNWTLKYANANQLDRIAFSKSDEDWTTGFVLSEGRSLKVVPTIKNQSDREKTEEEIKKAFCDFANELNTLN